MFFTVFHKKNEEEGHGYTGTKSTQLTDISGVHMVCNVHVSILVETCSNYD